MITEQVTQQVSQKTANQFYIYMDKNLIPWDIYVPDQGNRGFTSYFSKVLQVVDRTIPDQGLTFYVTMKDLKELPSYGDDVFVLILGDEFYRVPDYAHKVGGIFKCYGIHQIREQLMMYSPLFVLSPLKILMLGQSFKNLLHRLLRKIKYKLRKLKRLLLGRAKFPPIYDIPLGYFNSEDLPIQPIETRSTDVFFDGSVIQTHYPVWSLRYWSKTPKTYSREQMVLNLQQFKEKHPQYQVNLSVTAGFGEQSHPAHQNSYSQSMMNTKVCLSPRGTTLETYRFFEAMRYGCVIITETLPSRWFYNGAPVIQISDWQNLETVLQKLLDNPQLMQDLHQRTLSWWENKCSETAVGKFIAEQINSLLISRLLHK